MNEQDQPFDVKGYYLRLIEPLLHHLTTAVANGKPDNRSDLDRHFAILRTELDKVRAYYQTYIAPSLEAGE